MDWLVRFDLAREKRLIQDNYKSFKGVVVDAHIIETFPDSTSRFLSTLQIPFIIDPVSYKFSTFNSVQIYSGKRWYPRLFSAYFDGVINDQAQIDRQEETNTNEADSDLMEQPAIRIEPNDLDNQTVLKNYVQKILSYQRDTVNNRISVLQMFEHLPSTKPAILIPPYSIVMSRNDPWFDKNIEFINEAVRQKQEDDTIYAVIPIYKDLIHQPEFIQRLIKAYKIDGVDGYFPWITDFKESREDLNCIQNYLRFFKLLKANKKDVVNFYGGYISMIASSIGLLNGFTSGIGYAEYRNPFSEGGPPPQQYYYEPFHLSIPLDEVNIIQKISRKQQCTCHECSRTKDLIDLEFNQGLQHLINKKNEEIALLKNKGIDEIIKEITDDFNLINGADQDHSRIQHYRHLEKWATALANLHNDGII